MSRPNQQRSSIPDHGKHFVPGGEAAPDLAPQPLDHFKRGYRERADQRDRETEFLNGDFYGHRNGPRPSDVVMMTTDDRRINYQHLGAGRRGDRGGGGGDRGSFVGGGDRGSFGGGGDRGSFGGGGDRGSFAGSGFGAERRGTMDGGGDTGRSQIIMGLDVQALVDRLCRRDIDVFQELGRARSEYSAVFNSGKAITAIISNLARRRNLHLANAVWSWVDQAGIPKNTFHYNSMISCCEKVRDYKKAIQLMDEMQSKKITKNEVTFSSAISACEKCGQWRAALDLLEQMKREGAGQTAIAYNAAISACEKGLVPHKALEIFEQMKREGIKPTVVTYSALISAAEKGQQWKLALEVLEEMKAEGHGANVIAYSAAISACSKGQMWQKALELFREIEAMGGKPSIVTYNATMTALEKGLQWERALDLFDEMKSKNMPVTVVSYGSAISACEKGLQYRQCLEFLDEMTEMDIKKNVIIFGAAMSCMEKSCRADIAFQLMDRMKFEGVAPNVHIYNSAISACARCNLWEKGYELFQEMEAVGVKRDVVTYNAVLDAVCTQVQLGRRLFTEGVELGFYSRVSRLGAQWLELDLHFLSLGGGEIALGWWFEECLVAYLVNTSKLEAVQSISIVTGYGKTRTRGSRLNDDGMRLRVKAMLNYMNIKETPQPNKGRIHIDKSELVNEVTRNGGKIVFDIAGYTKFKAEETTANMYPDVPQILRPRFRPAAPGEGPAGTFIREGALVEPQPPLPTAHNTVGHQEGPDRWRSSNGEGHDGSSRYGDRRTSERGLHDVRRGSQFEDRRGSAYDWDREPPSDRGRVEYQEKRPIYDGNVGSSIRTSVPGKYQDDAPRRDSQAEWDDNRGGAFNRDWQPSHNERGYNDFEDDRGRRPHQGDAYVERNGTFRAYGERDPGGDYSNGDRRHSDQDADPYRSEVQGYDSRFARTPKRPRHSFQQVGGAVSGFDDYPRQKRASDSAIFAYHRGGIMEDARHRLSSVNEDPDPYVRGPHDPMDRQKKRSYDEDVKPSVNRGYNIEPTYIRKR